MRNPSDASETARRQPAPEQPLDRRSGPRLWAAVLGMAVVFGLVVLLLLRSDPDERRSPMGETSVMPDIVGLTVDAAADILTESGISREPTIRLVADASAQAGTVVAQSPGAGARIESDRRVTLMVSEAPRG